MGALKMLTTAAIVNPSPTMHTADCHHTLHRSAGDIGVESCGGISVTCVGIARRWGAGFYYHQNDDRPPQRTTRSCPALHLSHSINVIL